MEAIVREIGARRAIAILRAKDTSVGREAMEAAVRGGFRAVEITFGTPGALSLIEAFAARDELIVGAGTVMTVEEAREAVARGARFLVSPIADEPVIAAAAALGVPIIPGCATPAEMVRAHRAGAPLVKLFPAPADGPTYVRQVLGPLPFLRVVPTAGVNADNAAAYLAAGAFALGFVSSLFTADDLEARSYDRIEARARALLSTLR